MAHLLARSVLPSLLAALYCVAVGGVADEPKRNKTTGKDDDSWVYRSPEHHFSITFPSKRWKEIGKGKGVAAFHNGFPFPMTLGVLSVKKESPEQYRESVKKFVDYLKKNETDYLEKPEEIRQEVESGDVRHFFYAKEKGTRGEEFVQVGMSFTWLKARGTTGQLLFEGVGQAKSKLFKAQERAAFDKAAKDICLSVR